MCCFCTLIRRIKIANGIRADGSIGYFKVMIMNKFLVIGTLFLMVGCGQKGALYLPDEPHKPLTTQPAEQNTTKGATQ